MYKMVCCHGRNISSLSHLVLGSLQEQVGGSLGAHHRSLALLPHHHTAAAASAAAAAAVGGCRGQLVAGSLQQGPHSLLAAGTAARVGCGSGRAAAAGIAAAAAAGRVEHRTVRRAGLELEGSRCSGRNGGSRSNH
jgi:hypothetical protein